MVFWTNAFLYRVKRKFYSPIQKALKEVWDLPKGSSYSPYVMRELATVTISFPEKRLGMKSEELPILVLQSKQMVALLIF